MQNSGGLTQPLTHAACLPALAQSAAAAQAQLNGIDFPPGSGCRLKVMFAGAGAGRPGSGQGGC